MDPRIESLLDAAADSFAAAGAAFRHFARWKYRLDPMYLSLLRSGCLPDDGRLLDLGCGQGMLPMLIVAAREAFRRGAWPDGWPAPPMRIELSGIELAPGRARAARVALGGRATIVEGDCRQVSFPRCSVAVLLDVLLYLGPGEQSGLLERVARALDSGGLLLMREADADAGLAFRFTRGAERLLEWSRGHWRDRLHYRGARDWIGLLETLGFSVRAEPMSAGTPFANVLFVARKGPGTAGAEGRGDCG